MKIDWDRRTCSRKGHVTYAPDDPRLRVRLRADTALGEVWRCLRCGDFVLGEPHGSGPAADAPLVPRGKVLRDLFILRFLAIERFVRGVFIVLVAAAVWKFSNSQDAVRRLFDEYLDVFRPVFKHFHYDLDHSPVVGTIQKTFGYKHDTLVLVDGSPAEADSISQHAEAAVPVVRKVLPQWQRGLVVEVPASVDGLDRTLDAGAGLIRIEVTDAASTKRPPMTAPSSYPEGESGRGLLLVDALAVRWGWVPRRPVGKTVWAVVPITTSSME